MSKKPDRFHGHFLFVFAPPRGRMLTNRAECMRGIEESIVRSGGRIVTDFEGRAFIVSGDHRSIRNATRGNGSLYRTSEGRRLDRLVRDRPELKTLVVMFRSCSSNPPPPSTSALPAPVVFHNEPDWTITH